MTTNNGPVKLTPAQRVVLSRALRYGGLVNDWRNAFWSYRTVCVHRIMWRQHRMIERLFKAGLLAKEDPDSVQYHEIYLVTIAGRAALQGGAA